MCVKCLEKKQKNFEDNSIIPVSIDKLPDVLIGIAVYNETANRVYMNENICRPDIIIVFETSNFFFILLHTAIITML